MSSQHADSSTDKINDAKSTIASLLVLDHEGRGNEISSKQLGEAVGLKPTTIRDIIPEIRRQYRIPVVSNSKGYYVVTEREDYLDHLKRFQDRITTVRQRQKELQEAFES